MSKQYAVIGLGKFGFAVATTLAQENAMILDGDQIIYKKEILAPEFTHSGYNAVWTDEKTDEWLMQVKDGIVCSCSRTGGKGGWQLFSVSRWNREDGKRLDRLPA